MEQQAEEWWNKNKDRLLRKYSTPKVNSTSPESSGTPEASEGHNEAAQSS